TPLGIARIPVLHRRVFDVGVVERDQLHDCSMQLIFVTLWSRAVVDRESLHQVRVRFALSFEVVDKSVVGLAANHACWHKEIVVGMNSTPAPSLFAVEESPLGAVMNDAPVLHAFIKLFAHAHVRKDSPPGQHFLQLKGEGTGRGATADRRYVSVTADATVAEI